MSRDNLSFHTRELHIGMSDTTSASTRHMPVIFGSSLPVGRVFEVARIEISGDRESRVDRDLNSLTVCD